MSFAHKHNIAFDQDAWKKVELATPIIWPESWEAPAPPMVDWHPAPWPINYTDARLEHNDEAPLTTREVFEFAGVPESTLRRWRGQGIIDHVHYPTETHWSALTARIVRVLARCPALSPELYKQIAERLRYEDEWYGKVLVICGCEVGCVTQGLLSKYIAGVAGRCVHAVYLGEYL